MQKPELEKEMSTRDLWKTYKVLVDEQKDILRNDLRGKSHQINKQ
jgi:hypothetical protein